MTLWSGRFDTEPDPAAFDFGISFGFDRALFEDDVTGSLAWAEALGAAGVLARQDAAAIRKGLEEILEDEHRRTGWTVASGSQYLYFQSTNWPFFTIRLTPGFGVSRSPVNAAFWPIGLVIDVAAKASRNFLRSAASASGVFLIPDRSMASLMR